MLMKMKKKKKRRRGRRKTFEDGRVSMIQNDGEEEKEKKRRKWIRKDSKMVRYREGNE